MNGFAFPTFTAAQIKSLNVRAEMFGKDPIPAVDIGLRVTGSNEMLRMFGAGWLVGHYVPADAAVDDEPTQAELDGIEPASPRPKLRFAAGKISIPLADYKGINLVIDYGTGGKSNIELFGDANKFTADLKDGGTIELEFRFQASGLKDVSIGKLGGLVRHDVQITAMRSAEADGTQEKIPGTEKPKVHSADDTGPAKDATTTFIEGVKADAKADAKAAREAERAAKFPSAAKKAASKKVVPFKVKAALQARKAAKK